MPIQYKEFITRDDLRSNPEWRYVFGDNAMRVGFGGQAAEMRGEPNAIGIATKFVPGMMETDFFSDSPECYTIIIEDLAKVRRALEENRVVIFPRQGIGTGFAQLPSRAPMLYAFIRGFIENAERHYGNLADQGREKITPAS